MSSPSRASLGGVLCAAFIGVADLVAAMRHGPSASALDVLANALVVTVIAVALATAVVLFRQFMGRWSVHCPLPISIVVAGATFLWLCDYQIEGYLRSGPSLKWVLVAVGLALPTAILVAICCDRLTGWFPPIARARTWAVANGVVWAVVIGMAIEPHMGEGKPQPPVDAPSVLLVTIDTLRADRVGAYGYNKARTPVIDQLARDGVLFRQAITQSVFTGPSHATILTGLSPTRHGVRTNSTDLNRNVPILADVLGTAGWHTFAAVSGAPLQQWALGVGTARKLIQSTAQKVDHLKDVHSTHLTPE